MANIELVIKISKEEYARIQSMDWQNGDAIYDEAVKAIHYGKLLPAEHGRLVDVSELLVSIMKYMDGDKTLGQCIDDTPTIIEADKAERSDKE